MGVQSCALYSHALSHDKQVTHAAVELVLARALYVFGGHAVQTALEDGVQTCTWKPGPHVGLLQGEQTVLAVALHAVEE